MNYIDLMTLIQWTCYFIMGFISLFVLWILYITFWDGFISALKTGWNYLFDNSEKQKMNEDRIIYYLRETVDLNKDLLNVSKQTMECVEKDLKKVVDSLSKPYERRIRVLHDGKFPANPYPDSYNIAEFPAGVDWDVVRCFIECGREGFTGIKKVELREIKTPGAIPVIIGVYEVRDRIVEQSKRKTQSKKKK